MVIKKQENTTHRMPVMNGVVRRGVRVRSVVGRRVVMRVMVGGGGGRVVMRVVVGGGGWDGVVV